MSLMKLTERLGFMVDPCASCDCFKCYKFGGYVECSSNSKWQIYLTKTWRGRFLHVMVKLDSTYDEYKRWFLSCPVFKGRYRWI